MREKKIYILSFLLDNKQELIKNAKNGGDICLNLMYDEEALLYMQF